MLETAVGIKIPYKIIRRLRVKNKSIKSGLMVTTTICSAVLSTMMVPALVATVAAVMARIFVESRIGTVLLAS